MTNTRNVWTEVLSASRQQWFDSLKWLVWVVIGALFPLWGGYLLLQLFSRPATLFDFASNGEFALYSAAFLMPALYLVARDAQYPFVHRQLFQLAGVVMLITSVLLFAAATAASAAGSEPATIGTISLNRNMLVHLSVSLFVGTLLFAFVVNLLDDILDTFDPSANAAKEQDAFLQAYRATEDDDGK